LLDFIELQIANTIHPENYYRKVETHFKSKLEILKLAQEHKSLDDMNPADVSMAVLDQLPVVVRKHTKNKCLFTQEFLSLNMADLNTEKAAANYLNTESDKFLLNRLLKHFVFLKRYAFIDVNILASIFAPSLIIPGSQGQEKVIKFLEKLMNIILNNSSSAYAVNNLIETLNESKSMTETSINQELLAASSSKLKESNFYQDFINSTQSSNRSKQLRFADQKKRGDESEDEENDEIDALVAPKSLVSTNNSSILKNAQKTSNIKKSARGICFLKIYFLFIY
jgi:hypothetical protein